MLPMKCQLRLGVAALALLAGAGVAMAADAGSTSKDHLNLTSAQQKDIWQSVSKQNMKETTPAGFKAMIGELVPTSIKLHALPSDATREVPAIKPYEFAMLQDQVLLVDPKSKKIADIIKQ
jgi:hypothetical protein